MCVIVGFVGIFASFAALMFNCVRKEDIDYSPYEEGEWRFGISPSTAVSATAICFHLFTDF